MFVYVCPISCKYIAVSSSGVIISFFSADLYKSVVRKQKTISSSKANSRPIFSHASLNSLV